MQEDQSTLTISKIRNILKLQQLFHNKFLTVELVHELISLYTCCVEVIDEKQEQLRTYFLEKIQFVLSRAEVHALLNTVNNIDEKLVDNLRDTLRITERNEMSVHAKTQALAPNFDKKRLYNYDGDNPDEKKKKIDIQLQLMNQMENNMKNLSSQVQAADLKYKQEHKMIKNIALEQNNKLQERLARRKNKRRKQSADEQKQQDLLTVNAKIDKIELMRAQKEINQAVIRITVRATQRHNMGNKGQEAKEGKGRVKNIKREQLEED